MDDKWFKKRQKEVGVTAEDIAAEMGRARSGVSHIYSGHQKMSLDWARAFAKVLEVSIEDVLTHAGVSSEQEAQRIAPGFAENEAVPFVGAPNAKAAIAATAATLGGGVAGIDVWVVNSFSLSLLGYFPNDFILVDTHQSERCKAGDIVIAQVYSWQNGTAETVLRRFEPPVILSTGSPQEPPSALVVDNNNVVIKGKVIASWRAA